MNAPTEHSKPLNMSNGDASIFPAAYRILPSELSGTYKILGEYAAALRTIADHPALDMSRKEAQLKILAQAIGSTQGLDTQDTAVRSALALHHVLQNRGLDIQDAGQMLQAADQDIHKISYPDWSDLLAWCRFWAAPIGRIAFSLAKGGEQGQAKAESFAIAVQILHLVEQAPAQYRWLGRVYLPTRWFREAGSDVSELTGVISTDGLNRVFAHALGEARQLLDASAGFYRHLPTRRLRIAGATAQCEAYAWAHVLGRADILIGARRLNGINRLIVSLTGFLRGLIS